MQSSPSLESIESIVVLTSAGPATSDSLFAASLSPAISHLKRKWIIVIYHKNHELIHKNN